jgi:methionine sulfoxide reductase heme-binding subunit
MNEPVRHAGGWAQRHFDVVRRASFVLCATPALWLAGEWLTGSLGVNALNRLLHVSGTWALVMLWVSLTVTPLRRLSMVWAQAQRARFGKRVSDWNWLIRLRRQFGLFAFFYASLHLALYLGLDLGWNAQALRDDLFERPFIALGALALLLMTPLALTSNSLSMRSLGRHWRRLHSLSYLIAVLALAHQALQMKPGQHAALAYAVALVVLLGARLFAWQRGDRGPGVEQQRP